jgi:hypothetical protein
LPACVDSGHGSSANRCTIANVATFMSSVERLRPWAIRCVRNARRLSTVAGSTGVPVAWQNARQIRQDARQA